ncbi:kinesin-domain-containing protein [Piedraia hortae CBS 480.64]|uniref:Kinesin-domain-containing protein n=1 Tax=Piedraia hortae CBS 480.64 TaxID=1314780 RepID=A0A6A7C441_9PEZI|nr:kinesin-domain-containing protein [Piedraia hortae CBS 480.64]
MSVRVVARIRPLLRGEIEKDIIVETAQGPADGDGPAVVKIPNPKKESEAFAFQFNRVYTPETSQSQLFDREISPTVKHLFKGIDGTIFAYGSTGTGKTYTMRGGKGLHDRGIIPRLLSSIYRRARKVEKDSGGKTQAELTMSYYEIYNDRVYDLFESPDSRTPAGLPIRDIGNGKAQVVGLVEKPCSTLKEFEHSYDQANINRSTSATKLNAHSSRSHAILCVKLTQTTGDSVRISTVSAIDLAGSEDNRRTENNKDRMVESASINKSLFVLAQCVEAISKKQARIPYRESKMTRILSLGQNNGFTVMILNLAPVRSYHLDTLSSLNFANRTKKIEVNEVENKPFFREQPAKEKLTGDAPGLMAIPPLKNRMPLRSKILSQSSHLRDVLDSVAKPTKQFAVYSDQSKESSRPANSGTGKAKGHPQKRSGGETLAGRPCKAFKSKCSDSGAIPPGLDQNAIEALIERKVSEALAERVDQSACANGDPISEEVQRRLDALERRVEGQETERAEGLQYLLMAKQHQVRGEDSSALKMYELALPHFPGNRKLVRKVAALQEKMETKRAEKQAGGDGREAQSSRRQAATEEGKGHRRISDDELDFSYRPRSKTQPSDAARRDYRSHVVASNDDTEDELVEALTQQTPRTKQLLRIINSRDVSRIKLLKGVGPKKAEAIVNCLCDLEHEEPISSLAQLGKLKGVGVKTVEGMRSGMSSLAL